MIARWAALTSAALLLAATAPAQGQAAELAIGAGSYNEAPVLEEGRYTDTIRGSETNIYAVDLAAGEQLAAEVGIDQRRFAGLASIVSLLVDLDGPGRTPPSDGAKELLAALPANGGGAGVEVTAPVAEGPVEAFEADAFPAAGRWYVRVSIEDPNGEARRVEFPMKLRVAVGGTPTSEPEPPIVEPEEEPEEEPESEEEPDDADESGFGTGALALIGLGGAVLGAGGAFARSGFRRSKGGRR